MRSKAAFSIGRVFAVMLVFGSWEGPLLSAENENPLGVEPEKLKNRRTFVRNSSTGSANHEGEVKKW